jgi:hypothetical protein
MKSFPLDELRNSPCFHLQNDLLLAGKLVNGCIQIEDDRAAEILAKCEGHALRGLGDVVAIVAQPIARVIDSVTGTNIRKCGGCKDRQAALNRAVPFKRPPSDH